MVTKRLTGVILIFFIIIELAYLIYYFFEKKRTENFSCTANFVQHYDDDVYNVAVNYMVRDKFGLFHITGVSEKNPAKMFNRKISFNLTRKGDIFYMVSDKNIRLPDDNFDDKELGRYEPLFFIMEKKDIYMRVLSQNNNSFVFMVDSIPTYVCNASSVRT